jgi:tetratricopeptide (TPR) repeat protein
MQEENWYAASSGQQNLAGLYLLLGELERAIEAAEAALHAARQIGSEPLEIGALARRGRAYHLQGELFAARDDFEQAARLQRESSPVHPYLVSQEGIWYAEHLCHINKLEQARPITEANLALCNENHWLKSASQCHRLLGYLETVSLATERQPEAAAQHYEQAVVLARQVAHIPTLIEALLARGRGQMIEVIEAGRYLTGAPVPAEALDDLYEALEYSKAGGYRIYEVQIRRALSLAFDQMDDASASAGQNKRAHHIAAAAGYDNRAV